MTDDDGWWDDDDDYWTFNDGVFLGKCLASGCVER
jgi:hypothetical protein